MNHSTPRPDSTSLPPTFTEETKREFDAKYKPAIQPPCEDCRAVKELKSFLLSRTQAAYDLGRAETLKEVREMCEGMREEYMKIARLVQSPQWTDAKKKADVLSDLITRLTQ